MTSYTVLELLGDGISGELSESVHHLAETLPFHVEFAQVDLSLEQRRTRGEPLYDQAMEAFEDLHVAIKYPTATEEESPNAVLRDRAGFSVIHRPVRTIPGIETNFTKELDIDIVRMATGGTYEDRGRRIGSESAVSLRVIERTTARHAARFAFRLASLKGTGVVSTSKYTIQRAADGLFEECVERVARKYPGTEHRKELFDALLARMILRPDTYDVIVTPNEYGDFLSDMACGLIGSIGLGDSSSYAFDDEGDVTLAMFDPAGGTAPDIAGQGVCNPAAALLAFATMLMHLGQGPTGKSIRRAVRACIAADEKTADVGGTLDTRAFTEAVARRAAELREARA